MNIVVGLLGAGFGALVGRRLNLFGRSTQQPVVAQPAAIDTPHEQPGTVPVAETAKEAEQIGHYPQIAQQKLKIQSLLEEGADIHRLKPALRELAEMVRQKQGRT